MMQHSRQQWTTAFRVPIVVVSSILTVWLYMNEVASQRLHAQNTIDARLNEVV
jgi:hypothetical protein